jgi:hypothetical protein
MNRIVFAWDLIASKRTDITGEEDEDVELELKGVKLFIKRGDKNFSDGMIGHIKLLSNKTTLDERLGKFMACESNPYAYYR